MLITPQYVFCCDDSWCSLLPLDTSLLISFNQPIMYCQPHSGILIGTLSQASLLPPPMSPHVENHHSMTCRNRECQVNILTLFSFYVFVKLTGPRALVSSPPPPFLSPFPRSRAAQTRAEQPVFGSEFGQGRCFSRPGAAAEGGVPPTHPPAPAHPPAHIHSFSTQLIPDAAQCTSLGAYPRPKCEDK